MAFFPLLGIGAMLRIPLYSVRHYNAVQYQYQYDTMDEI